MNLQFDESVAFGYKSLAQKIRVMSEFWTKENLSKQGENTYGMNRHLAFVLNQYYNSAERGRTVEDYPVKCDSSLNEERIFPTSRTLLFQ